MADSQAAQIRHDLKIILAEAERHGTLHRLKSVAIYFNEAEIRSIVASLTETLDRLANQAATPAV